ncbi:MAG: hypothetical protein U9M98_01155 [Patescibacteria group bacterium]|nr:hypothetical protein [Patescibacteria group bacterium]
MAIDFEKLLWLKLDFDFAAFQQELREIAQTLWQGWSEIGKLDCATVYTDPTYSPEIRFLVCNRDRLRIIGLVFLAFFALPLLFRILVSVVNFVAFLLSLIYGALAKIFQFEAGEIDTVVVKREEKERREELTAEEEELTSFGKREWKFVTKIREWGNRLFAFQKRLRGLGLNRIRWRFLREMLFFEQSNENLAGPVWSAFFLFTTVISPLVGLSLLVPIQLFFSSLLGFYAVYRIVRYKVLLDPKMSYYWEGKRGPGLYILAGLLLFLYVIILLTAFFLLQLLWL